MYARTSWTSQVHFPLLRAVGTARLAKLDDSGSNPSPKTFHLFPDILTGTYKYLVSLVQEITGFYDFKSITILERHQGKEGRGCLYLQCTPFSLSEVYKTLEYD